MAGRCTITLGPYQCPCPDGLFPLLNNGASISQQAQQKFKKYSFVIVRGTPASGKTTICRLICNTLLRENRLPVYLLTGWPEKDVKEAGNWERYLTEQTGVHGRTWLGYSAYLLLDEAQEANWDTALWTGFFKSLGTPGGPYVITFSSYGSPGGGYQGLDESKARYIKTPQLVSTEQRISLVAAPVPESSGLQSSLGHLEFPEDLRNTLFEITQGHVGAISSIVSMMLKRCPVLEPVLRQSRPLDLDSVNRLLLNSPMTLFQSLKGEKFARGLPSKRILAQLDCSSVLKAMVASGGPSTAEVFKDFSVQSVERLVENGWVHTEVVNDEIVYYFASPLHFWFCSMVLVPPTSSGLAMSLPYGNVLDLSIAVIRGFSPSLLSEPRRSHDPATAPYEDAYQKEFYRNVLPLLDGPLFVSPEYMTKRGGKIDLHICGQHWAIELVGSSDKLEERCSRFKSGDVYHSMVQSGQVKQYVVLDFTTELPRTALSNVGQVLYHVLLEENFRKESIIQGSDFSVVECFYLL
ncbi:hypothetical protein K440DRAFT_651029 [Wilcoxina mikolae CBS 423.85]|nr:hypothetical protein K440DRAFT_651029 [Wilcoxina mikolae CBS 423.85]